MKRQGVKTGLILAFVLLAAILMGCAKDWGKENAARRQEIAELQAGLDALERIIREGDGEIVICDVCFSPSDVYDEEITLRNNCWHEIDIGGWRLTDGEGNYKIPPGTVIEPYQKWTVTGREFNPTRYTRGLFLSNAGDSVTLYDADDNEKDKKSW